MFKFIKSLISAAINKAVTTVLSLFRKSDSKTKAKAKAEAKEASVNNTTAESTAVEPTPEVEPIVKDEPTNILLIMGEVDSPKAIVDAFDSFTEKTQAIADIGAEDMADTIKPAKKPTSREVREARKNKRRNA